MAPDATLKAESQKLQEALFYSVYHELKTPLTVIAGSAEHLEKEIDRETFKKLVSEIRIASKRLLQTVNGLLDMTSRDGEVIRLNLK